MKQFLPEMLVTMTGFIFELPKQKVVSVIQETTILVQLN